MAQRSISTCSEYSEWNLHITSSLSVNGVESNSSHRGPKRKMMAAFQQIPIFYRRVHENVSLSFVKKFDFVFHLHDYCV